MFIKPETKAKLKAVWIEKSPDLAVVGAVTGAVAVAFIKYAGANSKAYTEHYENKTKLDTDAYNVWFAQQLKDVESSAKE